MTEHNGVTQTVLTIAGSYFCFYVAEGIFSASGVMAVVFMGGTLSATFWPVVADRGLLTLNDAVKYDQEGNKERALSLYEAGVQQLLDGLKSEVLVPNNLQCKSSPGTASIGGVGSSHKSSELHHVPAASLAKDRWNANVVVIFTFHSQEIDDACPALWCYASQCHLDAHVLCQEALIRVLTDDEYWVFCKPTRSGHLLLPIDY